MFYNFFKNIVEAFRRFISIERFVSFIEIIFYIILIVVIAKIALKFINLSIKKLLTPREDANNFKYKQQRNLTIIPLLNNISQYLIYFFASLIILQKLGVDITAIIAGAGVLGLAVGFGAQSLIKDFISGFNILFEGFIAVGDIITIGEHTGVVEKIGIRFTQIRKFSGELRVIPNGDLTNFGNLNRDFSRAVVNVSLPYSKDIKKMMEGVSEVACRWAEEKKDIVLEMPQVEGVLSLGSREVLIRIVAKVKPMSNFKAELELRILLKEFFDSNNISLPIPIHEIRLSKEGEFKYENRFKEL